MKEQEVEKVVRDYIKTKYNPKGWNFTKSTKELKRPGQHGADILLYKKGYGYWTIEVKNYYKKEQSNYTAFYNVLGQILTRINEIPSSNYALKKKFVIAAPKEFVIFTHKLIHNIKNEKRKGMKGGWELFGKATNLSVWAVDMDSKRVKEYTWKDLLKDKM